MPSIHPIDSDGSDGSLSRRVSPFGYLRIAAYLRLPAAFRSWSRPSSANGALASTLCSSLLDFLLLRPFFFLSPVTASSLTSDLRLPLRPQLSHLRLVFQKNSFLFSVQLSRFGALHFFSAFREDPENDTASKFSNDSLCSSHFPQQSSLTDRP